MKIIVFGATGTIGTLVVAQALEKGHEVTAFARSSAKLALEHASLNKIQGNVLDAKAVQRAITGNDAVIIVLGSGKSRKSTIRSEGTQVIIKAMQNTNTKRLICQTTLGCGDSHQNLNFFWKYIMFGWFLKGVFQDHVLQEQYVLSSGLDWTIVRPSAFVDGKKTEQYLHGFTPTQEKLTLKISRSDVAHFIVQQTHSLLYLHQSPGVSN